MPEELENTDLANIEQQIESTESPPESEPQSPPVGEPPAESAAGDPSGASIPSWRLREEAEARRMAEERAMMLEQHLQQINAHMQQQQAQQQQKPDWFENPDAATQMAVVQMLQPFARQVQAQVMAAARMAASAVHGQEKVDEAEQAFLQARDAQTLDPADFERVVQSPNRYDSVVQWYKRQKALSTVGDDPDAWFKKQLEARMTDPQFQAEFLEKIRSGASARPSTTRLPPSLSRTTSVAPNGPLESADMSDEALWANALK